MDAKLAAGREIHLEGMVAEVGGLGFLGLGECQGGE
jgi:hypothetical protein